MNNFELAQRLDEALRREFRREMANVFNGMLGLDEASNQWNDTVYDAINEVLGYPIGGHSVYSPYNEPLVQAITLSDMTKNDAERAVRQTLMEWSGLK